MKFGFSKDEILAWNEFYKIAILLTIEGLEIEENLSQVNISVLSQSESRSISSYYSRNQYRYSEIFNIQIDEEEREKEEKLILENLRKIQESYKLSKEN